MIPKDETKAIVRFINLCVLALIILFVAQFSADIREVLQLG